MSDENVRYVPDPVPDEIQKRADDFENLPAAEREKRMRAMNAGESMDDMDAEAETADLDQGFPASSEG